MLWIQQNNWISGLNVKQTKRKTKPRFNLFALCDRVEVWESWEEYEILDGL